MDIFHPYFTPKRGFFHVKAGGSKLRANMQRKAREFEPQGAQMESPRGPLSKEGIWTLTSADEH
jgi:hypothetical protein